MESILKHLNSNARCPCYTSCTSRRRRRICPCSSTNLPLVRMRIIINLSDMGRVKAEGRYYRTKTLVPLIVSLPFIFAVLACEKPSKSLRYLTSICAMAVPRDARTDCMLLHFLALWQHGSATPLCKEMLLPWFSAGPCLRPPSGTNHVIEQQAYFHGSLAPRQLLPLHPAAISSWSRTCLQCA